MEQREIKQGIEGLAKREIIEGVEPGEKLVTEGKNRLVNGAPIEIIPEMSLKFMKRIINLRLYPRKNILNY